MEYEQIVQLVGTLGFPIVCCGYLFWQQNRTAERHKEEVDKLSDIIGSLKETLTANTEVMKQVLEKIKER